MMDAAALSLELALRVDDLVPALLPTARRSGNYFTCGDVDGNPGDSLYIHRGGAKAGRWTDSAAGVFGDLLDLIAAVHRCDGRDAQRWARQWLGVEPGSPAARPAPAPRLPEPESPTVAVARSIWTRSVPIGPDSPAARYLRARGIMIAPPPTLRYAAFLTHPTTGAALPCMVAAISGPDRKPSAILRTFLSADGKRKAAVTNPKLSLGEMRDGAARLAPAGEALGLAEGIETALSAMELHGLPVWAACGSRMDAIAVPETVARVVIFADNGDPGHRAAERAADRHRAAGRMVEIRLPPERFGDWNDVLQAERVSA